MMNFLFRVIFFLLGLVFAASLAVAVLLMAVVWGLRYGWARLTGKPVTPWVMRFNPGAGFDRFRQATSSAEPTAADVANARARGESVRSPVILASTDNDVIDVQARSVRKNP
jgi:hypothetical protein